MRRLSLCYRFADVVLNPEAFSVEKSGHALALEPKSIRLLLYLVENRPRAVGKEELLREIWADAAVTDNALSRVVAQLRKAIGDDAKVARYIETVPTIGYRFVAEVVEENAGEADAAATASAVANPAAHEPTPAPRTNPPLPVALLLLALAVALLTAVLWLSRARAQQPVWSATVLGGSTIASQPRISPDGQLLAFRAIIDGLSQVAVMKPDSSSWTALTNDRTNGAVASVAWAWDGSKIYFDREWGPGHVYSIGPLGGEPRLLLDNAWQPEPLPDGSLIVQRPSSEGDQQVLRFWPDSGRTQVLPIYVRCLDCRDVRAFPDGREIAFFGHPADVEGVPGLFALDLSTLKVRDLLDRSVVRDSVRAPIAISPDGREVYLQRRRGDTVDTIATPRSGSGAPRIVLSYPSSVAPISQDVGPDGAIYMDHSGFERSILSLSPSGAVLGEVSVPELAEGAGNRAAVATQGGRVVFDVQRHGRSDLYVASPGSEPRRLLNSEEIASLPATPLGPVNLAFLLGPRNAPHIAIASFHDGSILKTFPTDAHWVTSMSAPADGQVIYYASGGVIWAQTVEGGAPRQIGKGYDVAVEPGGKFLYLMRTGPDGYELFRMPASGGEAERVPLPDGFNLTPLPLSPTAVDGLGRVLLPVNLRDVFFFRAAVLDPGRHTMTVVPAPPRVVTVSAGWTPEGNIAAPIVRWSSSLWRYRSTK